MRRRFPREAFSELLYGLAPTRCSRAEDLRPSKHSGGRGTKGSERELVQSYELQDSDGFVRSRPDPIAADLSTDCENLKLSRVSQRHIADLLSLCPQAIRARLALAVLDLS